MLKIFNLVSSVDWLFQGFELKVSKESLGRAEDAAFVVATYHEPSSGCSSTDGMPHTVFLAGIDAGIASTQNLDLKELG